MHVTEADASEKFLPAKDVVKRYGVVEMTLNRWVKDPRMNFPQPVYIGRIRYFRLSELVEFERARPMESASAA